MAQASVVTTWVTWIPVMVSFLAVLILAGFGLAPYKNKKMRVYHKALTVIFFACIIYIVLTATERVLWVSSHRYPKILATNLNTFSVNKLEEMQNDCSSRLTIKAVGDNDMAIRCGYWWPHEQVWEVNRQLFAKAIDGYQVGSRHT